jgi:hypothetical protein
MLQSGYQIRLQKMPETNKIKLFPLPASDMSEQARQLVPSDTRRYEMLVIPYRTKILTVALAKHA